MFTNAINQNLQKLFMGLAVLLIAGFIALVPAAQAQTRATYPEVNDAKPDGKGCFLHNGKRYCYKPVGKVAKQEGTAAKQEGAPNKLKNTPTDPQAMKDCFWHTDKNGKRRLACIYYDAF